jgi:hypothetical protein
LRGGSSSSAAPMISDMEKLTVLLIGLGDNYKMTHEILKTNPNMTYKKACIHLKEKAEYGLQLNSSSSSSLSSRSGRLENVNSAETLKKQRKNN